MGWIKEFKDFAIKGNVIELSVAVVIGAAFGGIVSSLVEDVITPLILTPAIKAAGVADIDKLAWGAVKYGKSLAAIIQFVFIAFVLFLVIKGVNKIKERQAAADKLAKDLPEISTTDKLLTEIRDALNQNQSKV
ncbi:MAG: large conductance mechanosensitive channel protein MscL [Sediminibacterium sp.]|nr:large conductance mechanosensitive channel protein MscL [Sediminibacterium sp.]MBP6145070.1 large conductance mechanosensitive channel protein MscL [Sediminibacterium sp.]